MLPQFARIALTAALLPLVPRVAGSEAPKAAVIVVAVADMFSAPDESADVVSQATLGANVAILEARNVAGGTGWFRIETPDTYQGWIEGKSLRPIAEGERHYAAEGPVFEVSGLFAYIYAESDVAKRKPVMTATIGARLAAGTCGDRWCEIVLPSGMKGWIQKGDGGVRDAAAPVKKLTPDETVALAKRFLGLPYLWGGTTPFGLDCSGFVQLLYRLSGIGIQRDADLQMNRSGLAAVAAGAEEPRDLVFFGPAADRITHVGMMVGRTEFINATTHDRPVVQISDLGDPYWRNLYRGARRPQEPDQGPELRPCPCPWPWAGRFFWPLCPCPSFSWSSS